jgi:hypothetical protein
MLIFVFYNTEKEIEIILFNFNFYASIVVTT